MGIPKAFRWLSERYPLISQLIQENRIPEFDNLYLDMNGIIHNCSHNNNEDIHFRVTEEQIFLAVFAYIEHLFSKIKPKKLFFMAIDGVAPRAKMNQQRSRRFRSAKETNDRILEARRKGEDIPDDMDDAFQSNQITPGTPFMARLTAQLKYFINKKVTEDSDWRGVQVVLSGHEVPGEGEHKIMEYIRLAKAQPEYNANTRHCLYGLDADLIMLGLLSHDPHFCLLREEVVFGPQRAKAKSKGLESTNFYLMHLSLLREYLDIEFSDLKNTMPRDGSHTYDLERIIDDFILLAIFIGNDFLPHLPDLHINEGAFNLLFRIYKEILPSAGGYLNEHGKLNTARLQTVLDKLAEFELEKFEEEHAGSGWAQIKYAAEDAAKAAKKQGKKGKTLALTQAQRKTLASVKTFLFSNLEEPSLVARLDLPYSSNQADRHFLQKLCEELKLDIAFDEVDDNDEMIIVVRFSQEILDILEEEAEEDEDEEDEADEGEEGDGAWEDVDGDEEDAAEGDNAESGIADATDALGKVALSSKHAGPAKTNLAETSEWYAAVERVFQKYEKAPNAKQLIVSQAEADAEYKKVLEAKFHESKVDYYNEKLEFNINTDKQAMRDMAFAYIEGLQWVLHYYYDGVASWSWFYPYHYSPKISNLTNVAQMQFDFDLNKPFRPFEQLMGVLPDLSASLVPVVYRDLMSDPNSPIIDFYPRDFGQDLNGKKAEWEAIVKIPFIDADRLLKAMSTRDPQLTQEERARNSFGESYIFSYDPTYIGGYPSSLPGFFPDLHQSRCKMEVYDLPTLGGLRLVKGLAEGALLGPNALPGFPSLYTLSVSTHTDFHAVNVFQSDSRNESVVTDIDNIYAGQSVEQIASQLLGHRTFAGWPFLQEAHVVGVSDEQARWNLDGRGAMFPTQHGPSEKEKWRKAAHRIQHIYSKRFAVDTEDVGVLLHVKLLKGLKRLDDGALVKEWDTVEVEQAVQATVQHTAHEDARYIEQPPRPVEEEYPEGTKVFYLGAQLYGTPAVVIGHEKQQLYIQAAFFEKEKVEPTIFAARSAQRAKTRYFPSPDVCKQVRMSALTLSKITSGLMIDMGGTTRLNAGLNLKFEARSQKVLGYAQRNERGWEYSQKAIALITEYRAKFPEVINALEARKNDTTKASDFFPTDTAKRCAELKEWIKEKGIRDFEKVSLYSDQMEKEAVEDIERVQDRLYADKMQQPMKQAVLKNIPRRAVLKPEHASHRLQNQTYSVGDRVITASEVGSVPLAVRGVVVGIQAGFIDVVFDIAFMGGTTLGGRCSNYRGASLIPSALINLSDMQASQSTQPTPAPARMPTAAINGRGRGASATAHPSYRGVAHRGFAPVVVGARGRGGSSRGAHPGIGSRGGFAGKFSAAAQGDSANAYHAPASQTSILARALTGGQGTANGGHATQFEGPPPKGAFVRNDYHNVPPPPPEVFAARGRGRGRGGPAFINGRGRGAAHAPLFDPHAPGPVNGTGGPGPAAVLHGALQPAASRGRGAARGGRGRGEGRGNFRGRGGRGQPSVQTVTNGAA